MAEAAKDYSSPISVCSSPEMSEMLDSWYNGALSEKAASLFETHLAFCEACQKEVYLYDWMIAVTKEHLRAQKQTKQSSHSSNVSS
jgi:hypothetical protein